MMHTNYNTVGKQHVIYIPEWLLTIAKRNRITVKDIVTNYENFKRYLSHNDQLTFFALQKVMDDFMENNYPRIVGEFNSRFVLRNLLIENDNNDVQGSNRQALEQLYELSMSKDYLDRARSRLFDATAQSPHSSGALSDFSVVEIDHECFGLCIPSNLIDIGKDIQSENLFRIRATEAVLKRLYVHYSAESVHQTVWYALYLELLWANRRCRG